MKKTQRRRRRRNENERPHQLASSHRSIIIEHVSLKIQKTGPHDWEPGLISYLIYLYSLVFVVLINLCRFSLTKCQLVSFFFFSFILTGCGNVVNVYEKKLY